MRQPAEPSAERGWLSSRSRAILEELGDPFFLRRLLIALAAAVALHEIAAGLLPQGKPEHTEEEVVAHVVVISKRTPPPTPLPTPPPTPSPRITPAPHYSLTPRIVVQNPGVRAAATPRRTLGGAAAHKSLAKATPRPVPSSSPLPIRSLANNRASGVNNGGAGTGAGPGRGEGGAGGTGQGLAQNGAGNGGTSNEAPCGDVVLEPSYLAYRKDGTVVQQVTARITLRDGTVVRGLFPYPFIYPSDAKNPFLHHNTDLLSPDGGVPVQTPPPGTDLSTAPLAVQVVLKYTDPGSGTTSLPECPPSPR